jgi:uncharacterized protein YcbK (DUF882 family)
MQLTKNFHLNEVTEWAKWQTMSDADKAKATELAKKAMNDDVLFNAKRIAQKLQVIREQVNAQFPEYGGKVGVRALSWLRAKEWELIRGRSGASQHVTGHAVDFIFVGVPQADVQKLMNWAWKDLQQWGGGLARLHRGSRTSFIHLDLGAKRRWNY